MRASHLEIDRRLAERGAISSREFPDLKRPLQRLEESGRVVRLLPTVYAAPETSARTWVRVLAVSLWDPTAVVIGRSAAYWTFWKTIQVPTVDVALPSRRQPPIGYTLSRRVIPGDLKKQVRGVWVTISSLTAIDLVTEMGGDAVDRALRTGATDLPALWHALTSVPNRRGNALRREIVLDSCDVPWSAAERLLHRLLRASGIRGWRTNQTIVLDGETFCADVLFEAQRVILEVDGWEWHGRRPADFRKTLRRHTTLEAAGWRVLHLSFSDLESDPAWVINQILEALAL